jgi:hypothetical protein
MKSMHDHSILSNILKAGAPGSGVELTELDVLSVVNNLMYICLSSCFADISIAASDTTSVALTFLLYYLLANRGCWNRLANEIRCKFHHPDEITNQSLLTLPFLDAVIHESTYVLSVPSNLALRLRPSVSSNLQRIVPEGGMMIANHFVPGGVLLKINLANLDCGEHTRIRDNARRASLFKS